MPDFRIKQLTFFIEARTAKDFPGILARLSDLNTNHRIIFYLGHIVCSLNYLLGWWTKQSDHFCQMRFGIISTVSIFHLSK